ncbi:MAG TPA: hypothetical protein DIW28_02155, partial [Zetaproteobacteria bacterium]|nr:hypothetical protein [Zetaproteobacteria bacterium]
LHTKSGTFWVCIMNATQHILRTIVNSRKPVPMAIQMFLMATQRFWEAGNYVPTCASDSQMYVQKLVFFPEVLVI